MLREKRASLLENILIVIDDGLHGPINVRHVHGRLETIMLRPQKRRPKYDCQIVRCHFVLFAVLSNLLRPHKERLERGKRERPHGD